MLRMTRRSVESYIKLSGPGQLITTYIKALNMGVNYRGWRMRRDLPIPYRTLTRIQARQVNQSHLWLSIHRRPSPAVRLRSRRGTRRSAAPKRGLQGSPA